jgi:hypothetical protein
MAIGKYSKRRQGRRCSWFHDGMDAIRRQSPTRVIGLVLAGALLFWLLLRPRHEWIEPEAHLLAPLDVFQVSDAQPASIYVNLPISPHRATGQFYAGPQFNATIDDDPRQPNLGRAVITIITPTKNPRPLIFRTVRFVREQSLQNFRWVIVNDHSDESGALMRLEWLRNLSKDEDPRIMVVDNTDASGGPSAMNFALRRHVTTPFVTILDDDDMWELTSLEKAVLLMSWVPNAHAVGFDVVNHGAQQFIWDRGFHNGDENYHNENCMMQATPFRSSVLQKCMFRDDMKTGAADWDLWLCMARHGMWGMHVPENGTWYQWNDQAFRKKRWAAVTSKDSIAKTKLRLQERYDVLDDERAWPLVLPDGIHSAINITWDQMPFANVVAPGAKNRLLLAIHSIQKNALTLEVLRFVQHLARLGWRVTVICTHNIVTAADVHQEMLRHTHDIFVAPRIVPLPHFPRFIEYLIRTRNIDTLLVAHAPLFVDIMPNIVARHPSLTVVNYIHACGPLRDAGTADWDAARESMNINQLVDLTIVPSDDTLHCLALLGATERVRVARGGANLCTCGRLPQQGRALEKIKLTETAGAALSESAIVAVTGIDDAARKRNVADAIELASTALAPATELTAYWAARNQTDQDWYRAADVIVDLELDVAFNPFYHICEGAVVISGLERDVSRGDRNVIEMIPGTNDVKELAAKLVRAAQTAAKNAQANAEQASPQSASDNLSCTFHEAIVAGKRLAAARSPKPLAKPQALRYVLQTEANRSLGAGTFGALDMHTIQKGLQHRKMRTGFGRVVQKACPERIMKIEQWIDAVERPKSCNKESLVVEDLQWSALKQCGAWCIANMRESFPNPYGWSFNGACFSNIASSADGCFSVVKKTFGPGA